MVKVSVILGYRDRDLTRVKRCLDSLSNQIFKDFELVFVDYGSRKSNSDGIQSLLQGLSLKNKYIYTCTQGWYWNRSHALNIGIRAAEGEIVFFGDVDFLYPPQTIGYVSSHLRPNEQIHSHLFYLNKSFREWESLFKGEKNFLDARYGEFIADSKGAHAIYKKHLEEISGYDEYYCIWGVEDRDLSQRLESKGLSTNLLSDDEFTVFHQWHPTVNHRHKVFPARWLDSMEFHFQANKNILQRNPNGWGQVVREKDRPILGMLRDTSIWKDSVIHLTEKNFSLKPFRERLFLVLDSQERVRIVYQTSNHTKKFSEFINVVFQRLFRKKANVDLIPYLRTISLKKFLISARPDKFHDMEKEVIYLVWQLISSNYVTYYYLDFRDSKVEISLVKS